MVFVYVLIFARQAMNGAAHGDNVVGWCELGVSVRWRERRRSGEAKDEG